MIEDKQWYPISLSVEGKQVIVVGGGKVALRKVMNLIAYKAKITIVSPELLSDLFALIDESKIIYKKKEYETSDIKDAYLVFAVTHNRKVNKRISNEAKSKGILVNVCDSANESSFIVPAVARQGVISIAVSTGGHSPKKAVEIRDRLKESL